MNATTIMAYHFNADLYHPACMILIATGNVAAKDDDAERVLDEWAATMGINRQDESTYDSHNFPKVIFADNIEPTDYCGKCQENLMGFDVPKRVVDHRMKGWEYEPADLSVGIRDGGWMHDDMEDDIIEEELASVTDEKGNVTNWLMITCPTCGEQRLVFSHDYDPDVAQQYAAREFGKEKGTSAAQWAFDGNSPESQYRRVLAGIEVGDPEIMGMMTEPLSGEWADGLTLNDVYRAAGLSNDEESDWESPEQYQEVLDAFEEGYATGYWEAIEAICRAYLQPEVLARYRLERDSDGAVTRRTPSDR